MEDKYIDLGEFKFNVQANGDIRLEGDDGNLDHKYIILSDSLKVGTVTDVCTSIMNALLRTNKRKAEWVKDKDLHHVRWGANKKNTSREFNYKVLSEYLRTHKEFNQEYFNFPRIECDWLDMSSALSINFHNVDPISGLAVNIVDSNTVAHFGGNYPLKPALDREGQFFSTFQHQLISRIINTRLSLVSNSQLALRPDWFFHLRTLIIDTISLLDITLNHIYIKAQYDPLPSWRFDLQRLGPRVNRRLMDKIAWVRQISGEEVNIETERQSLLDLKALRNHLNHFDPPSLSVTVEESVIWLNQVLDIARILYKIRLALKVPVSTWLILFLMQREAVFKPKEQFKRRAALKNNSGYQSSIWPIDNIR